jgi:hypothetical protein
MTRPRVPALCCRRFGGLTGGLRQLRLDREGRIVVGDSQRAPVHAEHAPVDDRPRAQGQDRTRVAGVEAKSEGLLVPGDREPPGHLEPRTVDPPYGGGLENDLRVLLGPEEVGRAQMLIALLVPGIDAGGIDSQLARDPPGRIDRKLARDLVETPANRDQPPEVLDRKLRAAVIRVESPPPAGSAAAAPADVAAGSVLGSDNDASSLGRRRTQYPPTRQRLRDNQSRRLSQSKPELCEP